MMEKLEDAVKTASAELGYLLLKEKQLKLSLRSCPVVMFAVNDVTFYDVMCIPRGQADGTLFTRPFLPLWVGGAGARDYPPPPPP